MNTASVPRSNVVPGTHRRRSGVARVRGTLVMLAPLAVLAACASTPPHYPSATAKARIGKPLFNLEMRWSTPSDLHGVNGGRLATWRFSQYNYAGCTVTVRTDRNDIIRKVTWTRGCGPKVAHARVAKR